MIWVATLVGILPVSLFLAALVLLDSYKLVPLRTILRAVAAGGACAIAALGLHLWLLGLSLPEAALRRTMAPSTEELLKALVVVVLIRKGKVGFMVDAGILGFAVGAGFALVENVYYLQALGGADAALWVVRGFGTAVLHGACTAVFAILSKGLSDRHATAAIPVFLPGLGLAVGAHALFNQFIVHPFVETAAILVFMPLLLVVVFERSEAATREWLGAGFDSDVELLDLILGDALGTSRVGRYLETLKERFAGPVVADMLCLLRIHLELSLRAKGLLIARRVGLQVPIDEAVRSNFSELRYLEHSIGPTGNMAILPILRTSSRDLWQIYMLKKEVSRA